MEIRRTKKFEITDGITAFFDARHTIFHLYIVLLVYDSMEL